MKRLARFCVWCGMLALAGWASYTVGRLAVEAWIVNIQQGGGAGQ